MRSRNPWLGAIFLVGWCATLIWGLNTYKPQISDGIVAYLTSIDIEARIAFLGWVLLLVTFFTLSCYYFAKMRVTK